MQKVVIKSLCIKVYYCWSLANAGFPSRCSRSSYLLNNVFHKNMTWITTLILTKCFSWSMRIHKTSCIHRSHKLMDWISTYDLSSLVSLGPIREDDNGTKWWLLRVIGTVSPPSYHFLISRFSTLTMLSLQIPKNLIDIISFWHKSRMAL